MALGDTPASRVATLSGTFASRVAHLGDTCGVAVLGHTLESRVAILGDTRGLATLGDTSASLKRFNVEEH